MSADDTPPPVPPRPNAVSAHTGHQTRNAHALGQSGGGYESFLYQNVGHPSQSPDQPPFSPASSSPYHPTGSAPYHPACPIQYAASSSAQYTVTSSAPYHPPGHNQYAATSSSPYTPAGSTPYTATSSSSYTPAGSTPYNPGSPAQKTTTSSALYPVLPGISQSPYLHNMYQQGVPSQQQYGMSPAFHGVSETNVTSSGVHQGAVMATQSSKTPVPSEQSTPIPANYAQSPQGPVQYMQSPHEPAQQPVHGSVPNMQHNYGPVVPNMQPTYSGQAPYMQTSSGPAQNVQPPRDHRFGPEVQPSGAGPSTRPHTQAMNIPPVFPGPIAQSAQGPVQSSQVQAQPRSEHYQHYQRLSGLEYGSPVFNQQQYVQNVHPPSSAAYVQQPGYPVEYSQHFHGNTNPAYPVLGPNQTGPMQYSADHHVPDVTSSSGPTDNQSADEPKRILVGNLPPDCSRDTLENYFENPRNFGGEIVVEHVDIGESSNEAVVTFTDPLHVGLVLDKQPCHLGQQALSVSVYRDYPLETRHRDYSDTGAQDLTAQPGSSTIEVQGFKESTSLENIELYFENSRRSKGGPIQHASMDVSSRTAQITFQQADVVSGVLEQTHTLEDCPLTVTRVQLSMTDMLLSGLPADVSDELLINYIEGKMDMDPGNITFSDDGSKALVQFNSEIDFDHAAEVCSRKPLGGTTISVGRVSITNCIRVSNLPGDVTSDLLLNYFENTRRSHGGPVTRVELHGADGLVFFKNSGDVRSVCEEADHYIAKTHLKVEPFHSCLRTLGNTDRPDRPEGSRRSQQHEDTHTIEVSGFDDVVTHDTIENYFENTRRSGGGKVDSVTINKEDHVACVTFAKKSDFDAVLKRSHTLEERQLSLKPLILSKTDLLLIGIPENISEDLLSNYIAAKFKHEPVQVVFDGDKAKAVVQFSEAVDIGKAVDACKKYPIESTHLKVSQVTVTNAIIVTNLPEGASADSYKYYFENTKRNGGGDVEHVDLHEDDGYCLVYFSEMQVVPSVCKRKHDFHKHKLKVKPYHKCLGVTAGSADLKFKVPEPLQLTEVNPHILKFLKCTPAERQAIEDKMSKHFGKVLWEKAPLCIECTLTKEVAKCREIAKSWKDNVMGVIAEVTDFIDVRQCQVEERAWKDTMKELSQITIEHPDEVTLINDTEKRVITLVARRSVFETTWQQIQQAVKKAKASAESVIKEKTLELWKVKYLRAIDFCQDLETRYDNIKVELEAGKSPKMRFTGPKQVVDKAQLDMHTALEDVQTRHVDMEAEKLRLLQNEDIRKELEFRMEKRRLLDVWQVHQNKLMLYGEDENDLKGMENVIRKILVKLTIPLDDKSSKLLDSAKWKDTKDEIDRAHSGAVIMKIDKLAIDVFTTDELQDTVFALLKDFMSKNTIYKEEVTFNRFTVRFMSEHMQRDIDRRMKDLETMQTHVRFTKAGTIVIDGTTDGIRAARRILNELQSQVVGRPHQKKYCDIQKYMASQKGVECIRKIETSTSCVVEVLGQGATAGKFRGRDSKAQLITESTRCASVTLRSGVQVIVMGGDMTSIPVDMMVNSANNHLKHAGGLAAVIVKKGGRVIQQECDSRIQQGGSLSDGEVFVSTAGQGDLPCKAVAHAVGPRWKGGNNNEKKLLQAAITSCLQKAEDQKFTSIAIPALSTGMFHYPADKACPAIIQAVDNHFKGVKSSIAKVFLCDISPDILNAFVDALQAVFNNVTVEANPGDGGARGARGRSRGDSRGNDSSGEEETIYSRNITFGRTTVHLVKGEMAQEKADVIVNSASKDLQLKRGRSSAALLSKGGYNIQKECANNYPKGIQVGQVAVTAGGKLDCTDLFHIALNMFEGKDSSGSMQDVDECVTACLDEAHSRGHKSIALPAVGTGAQRYPKDKVAATMFSSVQRFCAAHANTSLQKVKFVIYTEDQDTYKAFSAEERKWSKSSTPSSKGERGQDGGSDGKHRGPDLSKVAKIVNMKQDSGEFRLGQVKVLVYQGDITAEDTDGILASCNMDLDLTKGAVTKALVDKGGQEIAQKCNDQKSKMKNKGMVVTSAGQLQSKWIIFVDTKRRTWAWKPVVVAALKKAEKHQMNSLALPAVGTSVNLRPGDMANVILTAIAEFIQDPPTNLQEIRIVIFKDDMVSPFLRGMKSAITATHVDRDRGSEGEQPAHHRSTDSNVCQMKIYTNEKSNFDRAVRMFDTTVEDEWYIVNIDDPAVLGLTEKQIGKIKHDAKAKGVLVEVDQDVGGIKLIGLIGDVLKASDDIHKVLFSHERHKSESEQAKLMSNVIKWYYVVNGKEMPFPSVDNLKIETAHSKKETSVKVKDHSGGEYVLDLVNMVEHEVKQPNNQIPLVRRDLREGSTVAVPKHWKQMKKTDQVLLVPLSPSDKEYQTALKEFTATLGRMPTIICIERLQNPTLYAQYVAKRKEIELRNTHRKDNERILWHGTGADAMNSINIHGFNRSYGGGICGSGVYFAVNSQYSDGGYARPDAKGHKRMYRCRVMTGDYCNGNSSLRVPPQKVSGSHILYESVTDNTASPVMFVVFHDCQAYPEQIITYT